MTKGIILAGGYGSRLYPLTKVTNKHLLPIYDKPLIYYPLSTLLMAGIKDILIITTPKSIEAYKELLGDGKLLGINIEYQIQIAPNGIPEAFLILPHAFENCPLVMILGDNVFYGMGLGGALKGIFNGQGALCFAYRVKNPSDYGVVKFSNNNEIISLHEKPKHFVSNYAIPGLYFFDASVSTRAKNLVRSARGELEITNLLESYLTTGSLKIEILERGIAWLDAGSPESMLQASEFVRTIEERQGFKIGCPEEVAFREGFITLSQLGSLTKKLANGSYAKYLNGIIKESNEKRKIEHV
jgi:glucose-1-phosphate thymidylyltransferase